jgi:hypothetical protein
MGLEDDSVPFGLHDDGYLEVNLAAAELIADMQKKWPLIRQFPDAYERVKEIRAQRGRPMTQVNEEAARWLAEDIDHLVEVLAELLAPLPDEIADTN